MVVFAQVTFCPFVTFGLQVPKHTSAVFETVEIAEVCIFADRYTSLYQKTDIVTPL